MIVIAAENERKLAEEYGDDIIITGVGPLNVIKTLHTLDRNTPILNIGYTGSNKLPVGTKVEVGYSRLYHPNVDFLEPTYRLGESDITCYSSNDFVLQTDIEEPAVFDMELAYILALGFTNVRSIKIVSDNLDIKEYEKL